MTSLLWECNLLLMNASTDLTCPECHSHLTVVEDGQTEHKVFLKETYRVHTFVINRPFVSCDGCEWIFTAPKERP